MKYYHSIYILLFGLLPFLAGCSDDHEPNGELPDGARAVVVNLSIRNSSSQMPYERAYTEEDGDQDFGQSVQLNENKIESLDVFFVEQGTDNIVSHVPDTDLKKKETGSGASLTLTLTTVIPYTNVATYEGKTFDFYVVANCPNRNDLNSITTLSALKQVVRETSSFNMVANTAQDNFLMDGMVSFTVNWGSNPTYTVPDDLQLRRAASKIRLRLSPIKVQEGDISYEAGAPQVKLVHYTDKTSLMQGSPMTISDWKNSDYRGFVDITLNNTTTGQNEAFKTTQIPFYAYENDWSKNLDDETFLIVKVPFRVGTNPWKDYFYRIPVNYLMALPGMTQQEKDGLHKLQRNHLYDILCDIGRLGSDSEDLPLDIGAYITVDDWNKPDDIEGSIKIAHYLVVKELRPTMPNIRERRIQYFCDTDVEWEITKEYFEYYDPQGNFHSDEHNPPKAVITKVEEDGLKYLVVTSDIPINFVPLEILFTVKSKPTDGTPVLTQNVHVTQYPPKYVTGEKSPGYKPNEGDTNSFYADFRYHTAFGATHNSQPGGQTCDVFFKVTTIVNDGEELIGDPTDANGQTKKDEQSNKLISPQFIIASQYALTIWIPQSGNHSVEGWGSTHFYQGYGPYSDFFQEEFPYNPYIKINYGGYQQKYHDYATAEQRCANYFEGEYGWDGSYTEHYRDKWNIKRSRSVNKTFKYKGHWRVPTLAEIQYIQGIQKNQNSSVKSLLWGRRYWSAQNKKAYNFYDSEIVTPGEAAVRCVFDTYKVRKNETSK